MRKYLVFFAQALLAVLVAMPALAGEASTPETGDATGGNPGVYAAALDQSTGQNSGDAGGNSVVAAPSRASVYSPFINFEAKYDAWLAMVHRTHEEEQPDWMTPVLTGTPTLQQELRGDCTFKTGASGLSNNSYATKGTEIIPTENTELIFGNPVYQAKDLSANKHKYADGWDDWTFQYKYRLLSSPSDEGNYIVTLMFASSFATGSTPVTGSHDVFTPMLGFGKGIKTQYGEFAYQATIGPAIPDTRAAELGTPITWNSAFQYGNRFNINGYACPFWPEFEVTWTSYPNGEQHGQQQVYLTPGINIGRFKLSEHTYAVFGVGYQFAATRAAAQDYNHQWIATMRIPFF